MSLLSIPDHTLNPAPPGTGRRWQAALPSSTPRCNYFLRAAEHLHRVGFSGEDQSQPLIRRAEQGPFMVQENREGEKKTTKNKGRKRKFSIIWAG